MKGLYTVIVGPTGVDTEAFAKNVLERLKHVGAVRSIRTTTRARRHVDWEHFLFDLPDKFEAEIVRDAFLEWEKEGGDFYGTHREVLRAQRAEAPLVLAAHSVYASKQLAERRGLDPLFCALVPEQFETIERSLLAITGLEDDDRRTLSARAEEEFNMLVEGRFGRPVRYTLMNVPEALDEVVKRIRNQMPL